MRLFIISSLAFLSCFASAGLAADNAPRIILYTLGPVPEETVDVAVDVVHSAYGYYVEYRGSVVLVDDYGPDERGAYFAREILYDMNLIAAAEDTRVLVLSELKLRRAEGYKTTCGGLSHSSRGTAVFSTYNANKNGASHKAVLSRIIKRILHETGHASGLHHCKQPLCYMTPFTDAAGNDAARFVLCPRCSRILEENTGINYEIAREFLINILATRGVIEDHRDEQVQIPSPPDDLSYDLTGTKNLEKPPEETE